METKTETKDKAAADAAALALAAEADRVRIQKANAEAETRRAETERTRVKLYILRPKDANEPPFHFTGVAQIYVVAARSEVEARRIAGGDAGDHGAAWRDDKLSECRELAPDKPGLIARDMGA